MGGFLKSTDVTVLTEPSGDSFTVSVALKLVMELVSRLGSWI